MINPIIRSKPNIVSLSGENERFGEAEEITSRRLGAERTNVTKVTLWGPDFVHSHKEAEETYICQKGKGEIFINGEIFDFNPGDSIIISPETLHAARPKNKKDNLTFLCISSPAFRPDDTYPDTRGRKW